jgi:hypothetical protein
MKHHIVWNGEIIASFKNSMHRNQILVYWHERFAYAADDIVAKDD